MLYGKIKFNINYQIMKINNKFRSPNYSFRTKQISFIVIHYTEVNFRDSLAILCNYRSKVSAHYLIKSNGDIFNLVADKFSAWHAGVSSWQGLDKINEHSIGIEIENLGNEHFTSSQMEACVNLCHMLKQRYNINQHNIIGHSDIAPNRKIDPGIFFDWHVLALRGLGKWYPTYLNNIKDEKIIIKYNEQNEKVTSLQSNLKQVGYKIDITGIFDLQTNYVVRAFYAHFYPHLIRTVGIDFYKDQNSQYFWNNVADQILAELVMIQ
ncbi:MAG: N-acetylmuramoyl-L-alanine amidase [Rickettsiaceae bacterium]|nr:MAG: N-acetylmuramoyl-L-alanine amidase [Rickettsiaceae bacterium]